MLRLRKENGMAKIVIRIEEKCSENPGEIEATLRDIRAGIEKGSARIVENAPYYDEVLIDKHGHLSAKEKYTPPAKKSKPEEAK